MFGIRRSFASVALAVVLVLAGCQPNPASNRQPQADGAQGDGDPDRRPNILYILADDLGYTDVGFFGAEISTPNLDALANAGLRLTNFHAAPTCAPTRGMLMSGTTNGEAGVNALDDPIRADVASLPERLRDAGYHTYMAGKWNLGITAEDGPAERGFDQSFALMKAGDNHLGHSIFGGSPPAYEGHPVYRENGQPVDLPEGWFSSELYTDKLIEFIDANAADDAPWFGYLAFTAPHWPLQVPEEWIDRYAGRYDEGYNALLEARYAEARRLGILPEGLELDGYVSSAPPWSSLDETERRIQARSMEIYAAMIENMDMHVGRLVDFLEAAGELEDTVIIFSSDNGAERVTSAFRPTTLPRTDNDNSLENLGREWSFATTGPGWAEAATAPYRALKGTLYEGGTRVPAFVSHSSVSARGGVDGTYLTVMDLLPTMLDIAEQPIANTQFQGREVVPVRGSSFRGLVTGTDDDVRTPDEPVIWAAPDPVPATAVLVRWPWKLYGERGDGEAAEMRWSLFNMESDPGERQDVASERPMLTEELASLWQASAM